MDYGLYVALLILAFVVLLDWIMTNFVREYFLAGAGISRVLFLW